MWVCSHCGISKVPKNAFWFASSNLKHVYVLEEKYRKIKLEESFEIFLMKWDKQTSSSSYSTKKEFELILSRIFYFSFVIWDTHFWVQMVKFIYSEKATKSCKISTVDLTVTTYDKSTVEILQKFVAFSEYMNFNRKKTLPYRQVNSPYKIKREIDAAQCALTAQ